MIDRNPQIKELGEQFKNHLRENEGELVYWGEKIDIPDKTAHNDRGMLPDQANTRAVSGLGRDEALRSLCNETIGDCHRCPLGDTRKKLVFGVGNPDAKVMFIGEGPGFDEDRLGEPFVGKAGQLLDKIMASIGLNRTNVYIANVVKCHPMVDPDQPEKRGNDRPPTPEEMEKCIPFLKEQIRLIQPLFIVTLGATATKALLGRREGISALRGKFFDFTVDGQSQPIQLLPTFHPAALLRDETLKKSVWEDMKLLREALSTLQ